MWKQWRTCRFWFRYNRFVEKGMVVAVLADYPNYEYYLRKLTTEWEIIEQNCSDSWSGISDHGSRIIRGLYYDRVQSKPFLFQLIPRKTATCYSARGLYYDRVQSKPFLFQLIPRKTATCYSATICFICAELEGDTITVPEELHLDILQSLDTRIQSIKEMLP